MNQQKQFLISLDELDSVAHYLVNLKDTYSIFAFKGDLGAGKTTLIKRILKQLGVKDVVVSPTFTYVNTYDFDTGSLYHFDLYRLHNIDEFYQAGFDELLDQDKAWSFIEWPDRIRKLLDTKKICTVELVPLKSGQRSITIY